MGFGAERKQKRPSPMTGDSRYACRKERSAYSPGAMAPEGQTSAQVPQSTHTEGSIEYFSPSEMAPLGHSPMQVPQAMQSSLIT